MGIEIDWTALLLTAVVAAFWVLFGLHRSRKPKPSLPVSALGVFRKRRGGIRQALAPWPRRLSEIALALFLAAAVNPRIYTSKSPGEIPPSDRMPPAIEGMAIYFILDQSGSMAEKAQITTSAGRTSLSKIKLLKQITKDFIAGDPQEGLQGRPNDMIGLVAFARTAQVLAPLTLDHKVLLDQLDKLDIMRIKDQDGTGIGYAIFKTANLIAATRHFAENLRGAGKPAYDIKDAVMILVTDGMQDPNPLDENNRYRWMDPEQAAAFAKKENIRLYVINIDPEFTKPEWEANRKQMQRVAEMTGGKFYALNTSSNLADIYKQIDSLEKSTLPAPVVPAKIAKEDQPARYHVFWLYPYLVGAAMAALALSLILQTTWLRSIP